MMSAVVCCEGKEGCIFVRRGPKSLDNYVNNLLPKLVEDCYDLLDDDFIFHTEQRCSENAAQTWLTDGLLAARQH